MSINITNPGVAGITVESDPTALKLTGGTLSGKLQLAPITAGAASVNLGVGTAPTTTVAGDIWIGSNIVVTYFGGSCMARCSRMRRITLCALALY